MPKVFVLVQDYPYPFNPATTSRFDLPEQSNVTLTAFNAIGQEAAVLANGLHTFGVHEARFDATGMAPSSSGQASGVYFYRLTARQSDGGQAL